MKPIRTILFLLLATAYGLLPTAATAQTVGGTAPIKWVAALPTKCATSRKETVLVYKYTATSGLYYCSATNTWTQLDATANGSITFGNGTAASPSITFTGDTDTGVFRSGANALGFATGGTERGTLSSAGLFTTTGGVSTTTVTTSGNIELGNASDTTLARSAAGTVTIEGNTVITSADLLRTYLASDVTYNNTAAMANTAMSVTVASSGVYAVDVIIYTTNVATALAVDFGGTATMTNAIGEWHSRKENGTSDDVRSTISTLGTDFTNSAFDAAPLSVYQFTGTIEVNAGGTFLIRGAQRTATANNTVISRGSRMILHKLN